MSKLFSNILRSNFNSAILFSLCSCDHAGLCSQILLDFPVNHNGYILCCLCYPRYWPIRRDHFHIESSPFAILGSRDLGVCFSHTYHRITPSANEHLSCNGSSVHGIYPKQSQDDTQCLMPLIWSQFHWWTTPLPCRHRCVIDYILSWTFRASQYDSGQRDQHYPCLA